MSHRVSLTIWILFGALAGLAALALLSPNGRAQEPPPRGLSDDEAAVAAFNDGFEAHKAGDLKAAKAHYEASLRIDPAQGRVLWELGWVHLQWKELDEADRLWTEVARLDPDFPGLAEHHGELKDRIRVLAELEREGAGGALPPPPEGASVRIAAGGDTMMGSDFRRGSAGLPKDDGKELFGPVAEHMRAADIAFVNLEGPLIDGGRSTKCGDNRDTCYAFRTPTRYGVNLANAGVDVVSLANNHTMDFGAAGRDSTKKVLDDLGIKYAGTTGDIARWQVNGLNVSLVAFAPNRGCYSLNDHAVAEKLVRAEADRSHLVIVSFHGGAEGSKYQRVPHGTEKFYGENRGSLRQFSRLMIDSGADLVLGHGPHVLRGLEVYKDRLIAYSLGNFITYGGFNLKGPNGLGALLVADLDAEGRFLSGRIVPTIQYAPGGPVLDSEKRAVAKLIELTRADFPDTGPRIEADGRLLPRAE